jgi:hypothetical protein
MSALYISLLAAYLLLAGASFYADRHLNEGIRILGGDPSSPFLKSAYRFLSVVVYIILRSFVLTIAAVAMHRVYSAW